ncbi:MAG: acylphosphatase, partial [Candidatus Omnitrophota bacterium]
MEKQIHVYYTGRVQGVGFRFTAESLAQSLGIKGWVKNLGDGRVEVEAEAEEGALKEFLDRIRKHFARTIQDEDVDWKECSGKLKEFGIRF